MALRNCGGDFLMEETLYREIMGKACIDNVAWGAG